MITMRWPMLTGVVAALCTTLAFLPQIFTMKKEGPAELSTAMLATYLAGLGLWLVYGLMVGAAPVIAGKGAWRVNAAFGAQLAIADLRGRHLEDWISPAQRTAVEAMLDASFFADLDVMP